MYFDMTEHVAPSPTHMVILMANMMIHHGKWHTLFGPGVASTYITVSVHIRKKMFCL